MSVKKTTYPYGYIQKGNRYFWKSGPTTKYNQGFRSKKEVNEWIAQVHTQYGGIEWQNGFNIKFKLKQYPFELVNRLGEKVTSSDK